MQTSCMFCKVKIKKTSGHNSRSIHACEECRNKYRLFLRCSGNKPRGSWCPTWLKGKGNEKGLKYWHSLTPFEKVAYIKRGYKKIQYDYCAWCGSTSNLIVDHCHKTFEVRGVLCNSCNLVEGHAKGVIRDILKTHEPICKYLEDE